MRAVCLQTGGVDPQQPPFQPLESALEDIRKSSHSPVKSSESLLKPSKTFLKPLKNPLKPSKNFQTGQIRTKKGQDKDKVSLENLHPVSKDPAGYWSSADCGGPADGQRAMHGLGTWHYVPAGGQAPFPADHSNGAPLPAALAPRRPAAGNRAGARIKNQAELEAANELREWKKHIPQTHSPNRLHGYASCMCD